MSEWSKEHAWKVCVLQKGTVGSNPTLSAINLIDQAVTKFAHLITHPGRGLGAFFSVGKPDLI